MNRILSFLPRPATILLLVILGVVIGRCFTPLAEHPEHVNTTAASAPEEATVWTCSMHPAVQAPAFGDCPICGMALIPLEGGIGGGGLRLNEGEKSLAGIQTAVVRRQNASHEVRLVGKLTVDETALATLSAWVGGRLDRLYVDYTGLKVRAGDHMAEIYSPQLFHAQEELIVAVESAKRFSGGVDESLKKISNSTVVAARKKLTLYGLSDEQQEEIVEKGEPSEQITLTAPIGGTVIHRNAIEGQYVQEGDPLYTIADLNHLWLELDVYESDLPWIRYGQEVHFEVDAWPGEKFHGSITFLDPVLDPVTRTVHVRVEVDNQDGRLRPQMFARAKVRTEIMGDGTAAKVDMSGKWICPMHPEVISDDEGDCPICGMDLESSESLGFDTQVSPSQAPLLIPRSAPLLTGDRAIVFVAVNKAEDPDATVFSPRDIVLGPPAGEFFVVKSGLEEGEVIVRRGAFAIDSELQLRGQSSMMSPQEDASAEPAAPELEASSKAFRQQMGHFLMGSVDLGEALASDDLIQAQKEVAALREHLSSLESADIPTSAQKPIATLQEQLALAAQEPSLDGVRLHLDQMQVPTIDLAQRFGYLGVERELAVFHCPMALKSGADWIDFQGDGTRNPYYGASMLVCGSEVRTIPGFSTQQ